MPCDYADGASRPRLIQRSAGHQISAPPTYPILHDSYFSIERRWRCWGALLALVPLRSCLPIIHHPCPATHSSRNFIVFVPVLTVPTVPYLYLDFIWFRYHNTCLYRSHSVFYTLLSSIFNLIYFHDLSEAFCLTKSLHRSLPSPFLSCCFTSGSRLREKLRGNIVSATTSCAILIAASRSHETFARYGLFFNRLCSRLSRTCVGPELSLWMSHVLKRSTLSLRLKLLPGLLDPVI